MKNKKLEALKNLAGSWGMTIEELSGFIQDNIIADTEQKAVEVDPVTDFFDAVKINDLDKVKKLLNEGFDTNAKRDGYTALMYSAGLGNLDLMELLIEKGAYINVKDKDGNTALMYAACEGRVDVVKWLIGKGAYINVKGHDNKTALIYASSKDKPEVVKVLLSIKDIDVNVICDGIYGYSALTCAASCGYLETIKALLSSDKIDINALDEWDGKNALMQAAGEGYLKIVELLLSAGADVNIKTKKCTRPNNTALIYAARNGHIEVVKTLLSVKGININVKGCDGTALAMAAGNGHEEVVKMLLEANGININAKNDKGENAADYADRSGYIEIGNIIRAKIGIDESSSRGSVSGEPGETKKTKRKFLWFEW